ncbi:hypothetical protein E4U55_002837 [Claviceps digitariae]|nr:hypothetical protein E4U55_002837 [Claviceps digitariae]
MQHELTLIVATTRSLGIGRNGNMPWPPLRKEMQYFARVTSRTAPESPPNAINAVIMGRKTWDSIPSRFRPLKNRLNIVISKTAGQADVQQQQQQQQDQKDQQPEQQQQQQQQLLLRVPSFEAALAHVADNPLISRVFIMGGGQVYEQALQRSEAKRVLLTRIEGEFECDTHFGLELREGVEGWRRCGRGEWREWTGEKAAEGEEEEQEEKEGEEKGEGKCVEEAGVKYEWQMWEKK